MATWVNQGPAPSFGGQTEGIVGPGTVNNPSNPVSGAVEAIAAQPGNANVVYVGTVNGGVWKTTNATATSPTWTPLTDNQVSLSSGAIAFAPNDSTYQTLYVGTGSFSSSGGDGTPGRGLLKTTDGGATWTNLNPGGIFTNRKIKSVVPTSLNGGDTLLIGTFDNGGGVYRSTNGGTNFTRISGTNGLPNAGVSILVPDPFNTSVFYAGVPNNGVYRSDDGGVTWAARNVGITSPGTSNSRVEIAPSPAGSGVVFAALLNDRFPVGFYRSANSGATWTQMDTPGTNDKGFQGTNPEAEDEAEEAAANGEDPGGQGNIHFALLADRSNPNVVFASGDRQPTNANDNFPNSIGARDYSGRVFRGDASLAVGLQWTAVTNNFANPNNRTGGTSPHADSRDMVFDANGNILQGNDGGIYRLTNPNGTSAQRGWNSVVGNLRNTEFVSTAYSSLTHTIIGGAQDNGTPYQVTTNPTTPWRNLLGGDGAIVAVDDTSTPGRSIRYSSFQNFGFFNRTTWDANNNNLGFVGVGLVINGTGGQTLTQNLRFYQPYELNTINATRLAIPTTHLYESSDRGDTLTDLGNFGTSINGLVYGGRYRGVANPGLLYFGVGSQVRYRSGDGQPITTLTAYPGSSPVDMTTDPQNSRHLYVLDNAQRVWATLNAGATWINVTGNVASLSPTGSSILRTIAFIGNSTNYDTAVLVVGGYGGVYALPTPGLAGTPTIWSKLGDGMSNAVVTDLRYNIPDDVLLAGTLGRGSWTLLHPTSTAPAAEPSFASVAAPATSGGDDGDASPVPLPQDAPLVPPSPYRGGSSTPTRPSTDLFDRAIDSVARRPVEPVMATITIDSLPPLEDPLVIARRKREAADKALETLSVL